MADSYTYSAYGELTASSGSDVNPFRYGGQFGYYTDATFGTILCGFRWYDPDLGRWLSRDPPAAPVCRQADNSFYPCWERAGE